MKKTNINDLISLDKKFTDVDEFKCEFDKGLCFVFNCVVAIKILMCIIIIMIFYSWKKKVI